MDAGPVADPSVIPAVLSPSFERLDEASASVIREITLEEVLDDDGVPLEALLQGQHWDDPITETRTLGSTEIWYLINLTEDTHPEAGEDIDYFGGEVERRVFLSLSTRF